MDSVRLIPINIKVALFLMVVTICCGCVDLKNSLKYVPQLEGIKINDFTANKKDNYFCTGSFVIGNETILTRFDVDSTYSLLIYKINDLSNNLSFTKTNSVSTINGQVSEVNDYLYILKHSFFERTKVNSLEFAVNKSVVKQIDNDTVVSFAGDFKNFSVKVDNEVTLNGDLNSFSLSGLPANFLFYKKDNTMYMFILTRQTQYKNVNIPRDFIYNYLFKKNH